MVNVNLYGRINYYNRIIEHYDTLNEYPTPTVIKTGINFNPNDGVDAEMTLNLDESLNEQKSSYLIVSDEITGDIISRWFIMECDRNRKGQYHLRLHRDLIADDYDTIINDPMFIEKATLPVNNNLIFNSENMTYNQIKKSEIPLKDNTLSSWYVIYLNSGIPADKAKVTIGSDTSVIPDYEYNSLEQYPYYNYDAITPFDGNPTNMVIKTYVCPPTYGAEGLHSYVLGWDFQGYPANPRDERGSLVSTGLLETPDYGGQVYIPEAGPIQRVQDDVIRAAKDHGSWWDFVANITGCHTVDETLTAQEEDGKVIKVGNDYYRIGVIELGNSANEDLHIQLDEGASQPIIDILRTSYGIMENDHRGDKWAGIDYKAPKYAFTYKKIAGGGLTFTLSQNRRHLKDAPYDMICIPSTDCYINNVNRSDPETARKLVKEMIIQWSNYLYDVQLLPYCPMEPQSFIFNDSSRYGCNCGYYENQEGEAYQYVRDAGTTIKTALYFASTSSFTSYLRTEITVPTDPIDFKVANETQFYRLVSPNYNGQFEFKATKNRGVSYFNCSCTYRPYSPYIKVVPSFTEMYGDAFNDARGLICGGDFSLPMITDKWQEYEYNNKNYQNIFNREIENMDFNNQKQEEMDIANATSGFLGSIALGVGGASINPAIGIGMGATGAIGSGLGGALDVKRNKELRAEARDYKKDMFGYQLGNIKAIPYNLTRCSTFNVDNRVFPILEFYDCTQEEKDAIRNKIIYNGMTVMVIGKIKDYQQEDKTYIKGKLIRSAVQEDEHYIQSIANELDKGVFI